MGNSPVATTGMVGGLIGSRAAVRRFRTAERGLDGAVGILCMIECWRSGPSYLLYLRLMEGTLSGNKKIGDHLDMGIDQEWVDGSL